MSCLLSQQDRAAPPKSLIVFVLLGSVRLSYAVFCAVRMLRVVLLM